MPAAQAQAAIRAALAGVERRIDAACARAGRERADVRLLPVTKTVEPARIAAAVAAGYRCFGENRVQEALAKREAFAGQGVSWHMIGHLQRNKVKQALAFADCIQSVDRQRLVDRIADQLAGAGERRSVLLQVDTLGAEASSGSRRRRPRGSRAISPRGPSSRSTG
ncbi:MAG: alanine racemase [Halofilum sp. (in: g-proteobacteria)]|nr:alanine racemase [Halofilum sp. (in: g-proteobacteria)]